MNIIDSTPFEKARWPWPKMNTQEVAERALNDEVFMPNIGFIHIGNIGSWHAELGEAANSKKLWINSLVTAHACLEFYKNDGEIKYYEKSLEFVSEYLNQYDSNHELFDVAWKDEHAVSNRLFVLTAFIHHLIQSGDRSISQLDLLQHAERHARWLVSDDNYVKNNHGVMMDLSLAQYAMLIQTVDYQHASHYLRVAVRRLNMMLDDTFDPQGCCTENSPTYHFVNYSLFLSIFIFLKEHTTEINFDKWERTLEKAKAVGAILLRPDGTIPLIGDSESKPGTFFPNVSPELSSGIGYYPDAGLLVFSGDNIYFTFRAGGSKYSHRHVDDLSITLWANGQDFIVDSGLYNYDTNDKLRRRFISSASHSGFYLSSQGHVLFKNYKTPQDMSHFTSFNRFSETGFQVSAVSHLSKECSVNREITFSNNEIVIVDSFENEIEQSWRFQLVLHPGVDVTIGEQREKISLVKDDVELILNIESSELQTSVKVEGGYYSEGFMKVVPTKTLVIAGQGKSLALTSSLKISVRHDD